MIRNEPGMDRLLTVGAMGAFALATLAACGGGGTGEAQADLSVLPPDLILADLKDSTYPPGPYAEQGNVNSGDVLPNFTFQGYYSPTGTMGLVSTQTFGEVSFGMLHDSGARYAILNLTAYW